MWERSRGGLRGWLVAAVLAVGTGSAGAEPGVSDKDVVIGQSITLQGGKNAYGSAAHEGMKLYIDATNAAGGVNGRKLLLRTLDDDNSAKKAGENAAKLVADGAFVLFGSVEGAPSSAVMKVAAESNVPFIGPMAGPPALRRPHQPMVFPVRAEHRDEFRALMEWGRATGLQTVGFFHIDSEGGREHVKNVEAIAKELGLKVVLTVPFKTDVKDEQIDAMVAAIAQAKPDLFFNHGSASTYLKLLAKAKKAGLKSTFMGVNSGSFQIATALGPMARGMVFAQVVPSPWQRKYEISREYQAAAQASSPKHELSYGGLEGYMTAKALVMALRATGKELTRANLVKTLQSTAFELGGVKLSYGPGNHEGSHFVDLSLVSRDGQFIH